MGKLTDVAPFLTQFWKWRAHIFRRFLEMNVCHHNQSKYFLCFRPSEVFARITGTRKLFGRRQGISRCWMLSMPYVLISKPECVEVNFSFLQPHGTMKRKTRKVFSVAHNIFIRWVNGSRA